MPESPVWDERAHFWMGVALSLAETAAAQGEAPIGAVLVAGDTLVATGYNLRETWRQTIAHAEIVAINRANALQTNWRLTGLDLFVTLEPCLMCAGAIYQSRIQSVYYGALDPKAGALGSLYRLHEDERLNHRYAVHAGVRGEEASRLLKDFFRERRARF